jgi:hypothetical protein
MSALPLSKQENISNLLNLDQEYAAPSIVASNVLQKNWNAARQHALNDPEGFWSGYAQQFEWSKTWSKVLD